MNEHKLEKILYVEDEADIVAITKIALEEMGGYKLCICNSGKQALSEIKKFKPDLVIIDVMMPEMDGPMIFKALRQIPEFVDTPVIFLTAKTQAHEIKSYLELGVLSVITKPFDPVTLADKIEHIWNERNEKSSAE